MEVSVYYRGAMEKLHRIDAIDVESHEEAVALVTEELQDDMFAKKPFLAVLVGGGSSC